MKQKILFVVLFYCSLGALAADTVLKLYRPYGDVQDQIVPMVKRIVQGSCLGQSELIVREDAWRCEAEGKIYDPCFIKAGTNRTEALCPHSPWVGDSVQIMLSKSLNNEQNQTLDMSRAYPWGIELINGEHCIAIKSEEVYDQMPIRYRCTSKNLLVGYLQRCRNVWSMLEKTGDQVTTVALVKAWF